MVRHILRFFWTNELILRNWTMGTDDSGSIPDRLNANETLITSDLQQMIRRIVMRFGWNDRDSVDDVVQDCMLKLLSNLRSAAFEGRSSLKTYVYTIARRTCIDYYRAARAVDTCDWEQVVLIDPAESPEEKMMGKDRRRIAARVLLALPRECRRLWRAVFWGRKNYRQVAEQLGLSEGSVKRKMWNCRQLAMENVRLAEK